MLRRLGEPSVVDCFYDFLEKHGVDAPVELRQRSLELPAVTNEALQDALLELYKHRPEMQILFELMTDFDEGFQEWRYRHISSSNAPSATSKARAAPWAWSF